MVKLSPSSAEMINQLGSLIPPPPPHLLWPPPLPPLSPPPCMAFLFFLELLLRRMQECVKVQTHIHPLKAIPVRPAAQQPKHLRLVPRRVLLAAWISRPVFFVCLCGLGLPVMACRCTHAWVCYVRIELFFGDVNFLFFLIRTKFIWWIGKNREKKLLRGTIGNRTYGIH